MTYNIHYVIVFCPRYRRKIFEIAGVEEMFISLLNEECFKLNISVNEMKIWPDAVLISVNSPPTLAPATIAQKIKNYTGTKIISTFTELNKMPNLWTRNCFFSTDKVIPDTIIKEYIATQKTRY